MDATVQLFSSKINWVFIGRSYGCEVYPRWGCFWGVYKSVRKGLAFLGIWRLVKYYWCRGKQLSSYMMLLVQVFVSLGFLEFWLPPLGVWELFSISFYDPVKVVLVEPLKIYHHYIYRYCLGVANTLYEWIDNLFTFMKGTLTFTILECFGRAQVFMIFSL